jgi:hypothetical protein
MPTIFGRRAAAEGMLGDEAISKQERKSYSELQHPNLHSGASLAFSLSLSRFI